MIYINAEKENDVIILCDCGCESSIHISKFYTDEELKECNVDQKYAISLNSGSIPDNMGVFKLIGKRIKSAYYILFGLQPIHTEILVSSKDLDGMIQILQDMKK